MPTGRVLNTVPSTYGHPAARQETEAHLVDVPHETVRIT
jgi:hypothetical protein